MHSLSLLFGTAAQGKGYGRNDESLMTEESMQKEEWTTAVG